MKLILSETEVDAIIYCADTLTKERCYVSIVHIGEKSELADTLCLAAFSEQRLWEIHRAYKDFGKEHTVEYLRYPKEDFEHQLAAYLQIKHMLGGYSELVFPSSLKMICESIKGNVSLIPYSYQNFPSDIKSIQKKSLSRFKTIKPKSEYKI